MIRIRAFKAMSEPATCMQYAEGHLQVLKEFDIAMITPLNLDWVKDPHTYLIVAEATGNGKMLGGAKIQLGKGKMPLPIETAVKEIDDRVAETIKGYGPERTGELYGFWNAKEVAGLGIGNTYLTLAAIAVAPTLGIKTLFALCSPYTVEHYTRFGFEVTTFLGNNGTFFYPKKDLTAIGMVMLDCEALGTAGVAEKETIHSLRSTPSQVIKAEGNRGTYEIEFTLGM